ncbi:uncharacterized protein METZ01_LOCUS288968 [marine metagenome]|uniref:Uncharacterized protein n=1 Tax=marine metagenome TaxID=408172 RepID=A0A382LGW9_9ZZZZ
MFDPSKHSQTRANLHYISATPVQRRTNRKNTPVYLFAERHISFNSHPSAFSFVRPVIPDRAMYAAMVVPERYNVRRPVKTDLEIDLSGKLAMVGAVG